MTKKEIIAYLRLCADDASCLSCPRFEQFEYGGIAECHDKLMLEAADALETALREQEKRRWIPVTERLPEYEGTYLVYTERGSIYASHFYTEKRFASGYVREAQWSQRGTVKVTHWMPLPKPPKEDVT